MNEKELRFIDAQTAYDNARAVYVAGDVLDDARYLIFAEVRKAYIAAWEAYAAEEGVS